MSMRDARLRALICGMTAEYLFDAQKRASLESYPDILEAGLFRMRRCVREALCLGGVEKREKSKERSETYHE